MPRPRIFLLIKLRDMKDLFETPELIPVMVQNVISTFNEDADSYRELSRIVSELEPLGYTFDFYLDAEPFNLRKIEEI
jgi:hypothetical protein